MHHKQSDLNLDEAIFDAVCDTDNRYRELPASRGAFFLIGGIAVLLISVVFGKTIFFTVVKGAFYEQRAAANVAHEIQIPAYRAIIVDRNGEVLADNKSSFSVLIDTARVARDAEYRVRIEQDLTAMLSLDPEFFVSAVSQTDFEENQWIVIKRGITNEEAIAIKGLNDDAVRVIDDSIRVYPYGAAAAHIVGYTGIGDKNKVVGKAGLEETYDLEIKGREGAYGVYQDALGTIIDEHLVREPESSESLKLSIDAELQNFFHNRLRSGLESLGRDSGVGIALDPRTGAVLSLVSLPSFDPNVFVDPLESKSRAPILLDARQPLFNRAVSGAYSPGSTIKPLVALATLRENIATPETRVYSAGKLEIPNPYYPDKPSFFLDWKAHGWVDVRSALAKSSNIYFYSVGGGLPSSVPRGELTSGGLDFHGLGIDRLKHYWELMRFGALTGIDIAHEGAGFLPDPELKEKRMGEPWRLGDTYNISIGQGDLLVTPMQLAVFTASLANGGVLYKPFLNNNLEPEIVGDYSSWTDAVRVVREGMRDAVTKPYGTAHFLNGLPISVSGKTGSAQTNNNAKTNALFIGYAPAENPEIAILILVENAREGSLNTLPIAKDVLQWYYDNRLNISDEE
ncbi:MAG: penicillin-binding transpeptidase domain-containing protein [Patescibacteria group bacterium]